MTDEFRTYRRWFYAAAAYNVLWGGAVMIVPGALLAVAGVTDAAAVPLAQVIGMMVGVYAYGYYLLAREPLRFAPLIWVGLAGKTLGPLGYLYSAATGSLPWTFGWVIFFNDVVWWPAFWRFALRHGTGRARPSDATAVRPRGW